METDADYLSAEQAAEALGVTLPTLYAYASRGSVRSRPVPGDPRRRRYPREDVERLLERRATRRDPERAAPRALAWGAPVLESELTLIEAGRLWYRGHDALALARGRGVEEVAALLWTGDPDAAAELFGGAPPPWPPGLGAALAAAPDRTHPPSPVERCQVALPLAAAADLAAYDLRPPAVAAAGARILRLLAGVAAGLEEATGGIADTLARGWAPSQPEAVPALRAALVLCADHELNASAFTARCAASAEAGPYDVVAAGLAALKGRRHGGYGERVAALLHEAGSPEAARRTLADRLRRGEPLPGFGHPLYPAGDPRGRALLDLAAEIAPESPAVELAGAVEVAARELVGEEPNLDLGLVALAGALDLPAGAPLALFALGRTLGWIGHAVEQYRTRRLIRPRARYVGTAPAV